MPDIKTITLPSGTTYNIVDAGARELIAALESSTAFLGVTTTALTDGSTTTPITVNGSSVDAVTGGIASYGSKEFIWNGSAWQEFGDLSALGALAYKDSASATYTPAGSVSQPSFTGASMTSTGNFTPQGNVTISKGTGTANYTPQGSVASEFTGASMTSTGTYKPEGSVSLTNTNQTATVSKASSGTATYTPEGSVSAPTISVGTAGSTTTVNSITAVGSLPDLTFTVANENLTIGWDAGTLPTKGSNTTVKTGDASYTASQPTFTGTGARLVTGNISVPSSASFSGTSKSVSVTGTTAGSVSSEFTGTGAELKGTFSGTQGSVSVTGTTTGSVSKPSFTGTQATITAS